MFGIDLEKIILQFGLAAQALKQNAEKMSRRQIAAQIFCTLAGDHRIPLHEKPEYLDGIIEKSVLLTDRLLAALEPEVTETEEENS